MAYKLFEAIKENQDYSDPTKYDLFITALLLSDYTSDFAITMAYYLSRKTLR